jgi:hypothetical protein
MRVLGEALALWLYERGVREDVLGSSLKANWLQSGLGGVKIETSSMAPPANDSVPPPELPESGRIPIVVSPTGLEAPTFARPPSRRPVVREPLGEPSVVASAALTRPSPSSDTIDVSVVEPDEAPEIDDSPPRRSLFEQTRQLRTLVLASISVTLVLAIAVVVLLYNHAPSSLPPIIQTPPTAEATNPRPAKGDNDDVSKQANDGAEGETQAARIEQPAHSTVGASEADDPKDGSNPPDAALAEPEPDTAKPAKATSNPKRARPRKKKRYELGF